MQFPESWLRAFCDPELPSPQLADLLTMAGLEVEDLQPVAPPFKRIVVAKVLAVTKHPDADRLNICQVDAGLESPLQIVCGAANVRVGIKVPCALIEAELPAKEPGGTPFKIKLGKLRGVESQGMLCSAKELGIAEEASGLHIFPEDAPIGTDVRAYLQLDDNLFTLKLTPNLAHCLSMLGIAREVSALTGAPLVQPPVNNIPAVSGEVLPVTITAPDLCGRFAGRIIRGVNPQAQTPSWMVQRLERCGQRSISALVDISNYVMFEYGQPSHIFDLAKIRGALQVRWAQPGESLELLNGQTVVLDEHTGVVADEQRVLSLAGLMGGQYSAVSDTTQDIYIESAFWHPDSIAGRSRKFNFSTDAAHRFERGVDRQATVAGLERLTALILSICGGQPGVVSDSCTHDLPVPAVILRVERASRVIGMPITQAVCEQIFTRLGLPFIAEPGRLLVTPPSWRFDIKIEEDLIEELVRVIGFDKLPMRPPVAAIVPKNHPEAQHKPAKLRYLMADLGYQETINFSFVEEQWEHELVGNADPIRLLNPIASHLKVMRSSLWGGLIHTLRHNLAYKANRVRIFELGRVFMRDNAIEDSTQTVKGVNQPMRLAALAYGAAEDLQWAIPEHIVDFFDLKGDVETLFGKHQLVFHKAQHPALHPGRSAAIVVGGQAVGMVGELHPRWRQIYDLPLAPILFEVDTSVLLSAAIPTYSGVAKQQSVWRDLALVLDEAIEYTSVHKVIMQTPTDGVIKGVTLFDIYKPASPTVEISANQRSLAIRLELRDDQTTLTDSRIETVMQSVVNALQEQLAAKPRK